MPETPEERCPTCKAPPPPFTYDGIPCRDKWHDAPPQPAPTHTGVDMAIGKDRTVETIIEVSEKTGDVTSVQSPKADPLPCPFCLSAQVWVGKRRFSWLSVVKCEECGAAGPAFSDEATAIVWWNDTKNPERRRLMLADDEPLPDSGGWLEMKARCGESYDCVIHGKGEGRDCPRC